MATATKSKKAPVAATAATIGSGNPGPVAAMASKGDDMDSFLASEGVTKTEPAKAKSGSKLPIVEVSKTYDLQEGDKIVKKNVIDLWVDAVRREKAAKSDKDLFAAQAVPEVDKLRLGKSRQDSKFYGSVQVKGVEATATFITKSPNGVSPNETLTRDVIKAALAEQFGADWSNYFEVKRLFFINPKLTIEKLKEIAAALKGAGLSFGEMVIEDVEFVPTDLLQEKQTLDPKVAASAQVLREKGVLKPTTMYLTAK